MGYIRHDLTVISAISGATAEEVGELVSALRAELPPAWAALIVGPVESVVNGDVWFVMLSDGSKEGWDTSIEGERYRARFAALAPYGCQGMRWGDDEASTYTGDFEGMEGES